MKDGITKENILKNIIIEAQESFKTQEDLKDDWKKTANKWQVRLSYFDKTFVTNYYMGCGLVYRNNQPKKPVVKDILYSMIMDDVSCMNFKEFCNEFGYDNESIKALETYKACEKQTQAYYNMFDAEEREILRELLKDY